MTLIVAFVVGPLFTTRDLRHYFLDPQFWSYLTNIVIWIHYTLPGVFLEHPSAGDINQSIWSLPFGMLLCADCH